MIKADEAVHIVNQIAQLDDKETESHYKYITNGNRDFIIRLSNHHTLMVTWVKYNENIDLSKNICIVFLDEFVAPSYEDTKYSFNDDTRDNWCTAFSNPDDGRFTIYSYVYNCVELDKIDITLIAHQLKNFIDGNISDFSDPLSDDRDKKAKLYILNKHSRPRLVENNDDIDINEYIYHAVMSACYPGEYINPDDLLDDEDVENGLAVGPFQESTNESVVVKSPELINVFKK